MKRHTTFYMAGMLLIFTALLRASPVTATENSDIRIKITVGGQMMTAVLEDNPTTRAFLVKLPLTLPMEDLYGREMCFRFDEALPADNVRNRGYKAGEIIYWPPSHSFVIMYRQDGEQFGMQHIGQINSGFEIFERTGNTNVAFELMRINGSSVNLFKCSRKTSTGGYFRAAFVNHLRNNWHLYA